MKNLVIVLAWMGGMAVVAMLVALAAAAIAALTSGDGVI